MKDSGIGYLGNIPESWKTERIKNYLKFSLLRNPGDALVLSLYREHGIVPKDSRDDNHNVTSNDTSNYRYVRIGDFVVNKMKAWQGSLAVSDYNGIVSPAYYVYEFTSNEIHKKYLHYLLRSKCYADEFRRLSAGIRIGQWDLAKEDFETAYIVIPPLSEQQKIVNFLDTKCTQADTLLTKVETQIDKLKQYKQSLITETVTKGLDPTVPMKDSGVEWIGEIPECWETKKFKYYFSIIGGNGFKEAFQGQKNGDIPFCKASDINGTNKYVDSAKNYVTEELAKQEKYNIIQPNSILIAKIGEALKKNHRKINTIPCIVDNNCEGFSPKGNDDINYLYYVLCAIDMIWFDNGGTIPSINNEKLKKFFLPDPCIEKQEQISSYLDEKCSQIDRLIALKQSKIEKLTQYKKSLIYEYVTGKKEVAHG